MTTLFWVLIVLHVFLCFYLALLVLNENKESEEKAEKHVEADQYPKESCPL